MAGVITGRAARAALDYMTGKALDLGTAPQAVQLALLTAPPPTNPGTSEITEVSSTGYARQAVSWSAAVTPTGQQQQSQIANSGNVLFGPFTDVNGLAYPATHCALVGTGVPAVLGNVLSANESSVETSVAGWSAALNCAIARSTAQAKDGTASMQTTISAVGDSQVQLVAFKPVSTDTVYKASMWVYSAVAGVKPSIDIAWYDATNTQVAYTTGTKVTLAASTWTEVTRSFTNRVPSATQARLILRTEATAAGQVVFYDQMSLAALNTEDVLMTWAFDSPGQAAQNESLQISAGGLTMSLG